MDIKILNTLDRAANKLRNKIEGQDYFKVLLTLIFIKFLTTKTEIDWEEYKKKNNSYKDFIKVNGDYNNDVTMIDQEYLWTSLRSSTDEELKINLDGVFKSLLKYHPESKGIDIYKFSTSDLPVNTIRQIIELIEDNLKFDEENYVDVFGQIYEYFVAKYSTDAGRGGEFYTPHSIVSLMTAITEDRFERDTKQISIYDPTMGSAGMLVQSLDFLTKEKNISKDKLLFFGQEVKASTWSIAKMNFQLRGVQWEFGPKNDDTFLNDLFKNKEFDVILSNPPFNINFKEEDYGTLINDVRFKEYGIVFGAKKGNYNFFNHILHHLKDEGVAAVIMQSAAGKSAKEKEIRKKYLENNVLEALIALPQNVFSNTTIASNIWIFNKNKKHKNVLFLDLQRETSKINKQEQIMPETINLVKQIFKDFNEEKKTKIKLDHKYVSNEDLINKYDCDLSVNDHIIIDEIIETIDKDKLILEYEKLMEDSKEIENRMKKAIKLLN